MSRITKADKLSEDFYSALGIVELDKEAKRQGRRGDVALIRRMCKREDVILDLCCGYGRVAVPLARSGYQVIGVDVSPMMIRWAKEAARKQATQVRFLQGSMLALPLKSKTIDRVFCLWSSFNHMLTKKDQLKAVNEMHRVLRPGGTAFIDMPDGEIKRTVRALEAHGHGSQRRVLSPVVRKERTHIYIHDRATLTAVLEKSRFSRFKVGFKVIGGTRKLVGRFTRD